LGSKEDPHPSWLKKAKVYYCQVYDRKGKRFIQSLHRRKLRMSEKCCKRF